MEVLAELREELKRTQTPEAWLKVREKKRRSGSVDLKTHDVKCTRCASVVNDESFKNCPSCLAKDNLEVPLIRYTPGPYTLKFRKEYLEKLLVGQMKIQKQKNDPDMELILQEEIHEIQRIWRMEQGDWQNSVYQIYEKITGIKLETANEDLGGFGDMEEKLLQQVCMEHNVPTQLVSTLLNEEFENQGATRHSKIFGKIKTQLSKEWRDDMDVIMKELQDERVEQNSVPASKRKEKNSDASN
jgi:DNA sulfur modification protein DndC